MPRKSLPYLLAACLLAWAPAGLAQSAHWDPPGGSLPLGEVSLLRIVFDDCSPDEVPVPPKVDGLRIAYEGQSSNFGLINGTFTRNMVLSYSVLLANQQGVDIPEFTINTNKGRIKVAAAHFNAGGATVGSTGVALADAAYARLTPSQQSVWAGEVFDLKYLISVGSEFIPSWGRGTIEWDPTPLVTEDWSEPRPFETSGNAPRTGLTYHTRAMAPTTGLVHLNPTSQLVVLSVGVSGLGFFAQRQTQEFAVPDSPVSIEVRPLPPAPAGFTGAVGDFKITSKVVPLHVKSGEPITWTVDLSGSGNWPEIRGLPSREAPADFQFIQPTPKRTQPQGKLFDGSLSEDIVLVPTKSGSYVLPPLDFTYFDPKIGSYRTLTAPGASIVVDPPAPAPVVGEQAPASPGAPSVTSSAPAAQAKAPELPAAGLGDPLDPAPAAPALLRGSTLATACGAPFALLIALWFGLAYRRALRTDPLLEKREARRRLAATLPALETSPASGRGPLILAWQRDAAILCDVHHAAPQAAALADPKWAGLWSEADRYLYGGGAQLAPDWVSRAKAAFAAKTLKPFSPLRVFVPHNLLPLLAAVLAAIPGLRAGPAEDYRAGNFASAEKVWSERVAAEPLDWSARHNLSLALSQEDRWGEATAQAAAAFVQEPAAPANRRQLSFAAEKSGFMPDPLDTLVQAGPTGALARLESPAGWQRVLAASVALLALSLGLLLFCRYGFARKVWALPVAALLAAVSLAGAAAATLASRAFGVAADARAVVVWRAGILRSIPTEADVTQKTTPLPAGSTAIADKAFLDWIRLSFPNGESGWVQRSEAVYLWAPPPAG